jgi:hypothetical protein
MFEDLQANFCFCRASSPSLKSRVRLKESSLYQSDTGPQFSGQEFAEVENYRASVPKTDGAGRLNGSLDGCLRAAGFWLVTCRSEPTLIIYI